MLQLFVAQGKLFCVQKDSCNATKLAQLQLLFVCLQARYKAKTKFVQPTPFGVQEQPSFDEHDDTDCVVCMDDVRSTIFVPCGHCLCCQSCAETVVQKYKHCPVCSTPVDGFCAIQQ